MSTEPVFSAKGLTKTYQMGEVQVPALRKVDLELFAGELSAPLAKTARRAAGW
jgi:putative ABC transport system ATP-binding protein